MHESSGLVLLDVWEKDTRRAEEIRKHTRKRCCFGVGGQECRLRRGERRKENVETKNW